MADDNSEDNENNNNLALDGRDDEAATGQQERVENEMTIGNRQ